MTLPLCALPCAARAAALDPFSMTERLDVGQNDPSPWSDDDPEDDDWEEFDPTPLEQWILDDFEWEIEQPWPERGDYWDDSLDGEWDTAGQMTNDRIPTTKRKRIAPIGHWCLAICHLSLDICHSMLGGRHDI